MLTSLILQYLLHTSDVFAPWYKYEVTVAHNKNNAHKIYGMMHHKVLKC